MELRRDCAMYKMRAALCLARLTSTFASVALRRWRFAWSAARATMAVATFLGTGVDRVLYPGLASHPQHALAQRQASGFGSMITFYIKGDFEAARVFLESVELFTLAESLGAVESLIESPAIMTHASIPRARRFELGLDDNLVRLSIGVEDKDDLVADLARALDAIPRE